MWPEPAAGVVPRATPAARRSPPDVPVRPVRGYGMGVAATYSVDRQPATGHPLGKGASPAAIRATLPAEDQAEFDAAYEQALTDAKSSRDLTELFTTLDRWRRLAAVQSEPEVFRRVALRVAALRTGELDPRDEPSAEARAHPGSSPR